MLDLRAPKHLVLNAFPLQDSHLGRGVGRYTYEVYKEILHRWETEDEILTNAFSQVTLIGAQFPDLREIFTNELKRTNIVSISKHVEKRNILKYFYYKYTAGPKFDEFFKASAIPTVYFLPRHQILTSPYADYTVTMVHDFAPLKTHRWGKSPLLDPFLSIEYGAYMRELKKSDFIVTNSGDTTNTVSQYLGRQLDVKTVLLGNVFEHVDSAELRKKPAPLQDPYFLYFSGFDFNKNIPGIIKAFALFIRKHEDTNHTKLVFSGGNKDKERIVTLAKKEGILENIMLMDIIPDTEIPLYIVHSLGLFRLSFIEGCGLPEIEVMSLGTPVVSADIGAVREMVSPYAFLVNPNTPEAAEPILYKLAKHKVPQEYLEEAQKHAATFTWKKTAEETIAAIIEYAQSHKPKRDSA